jgi:DNA repair protein RadA/Sms
MAKTSSHYVCQACGTVHSKWQGQCDGCAAWNTLVEESRASLPKAVSAGGKGKALELTSLASAEKPVPRMLTGIGEFDRVLGGGLVEGSAALIGGDPGIGKSTLLLRAAANMARAGHSVYYITGEESAAQIQLRARRLGVENAPVQLACANELKRILGTIDTAQPPDFVIIDSIQTMFSENLDAAPGTVAQVRACAHELIRAAKTRGFALILVGHVTKDGQIAGPRVVEHMVDAVLYFEGERSAQYRILRGVKNRFGATDEIGVFHMAESGLEEVPNPSSLFLTQREKAVSGACVFAGMEGTRPVLMEIQALVSPSGMSTPRRATVGFDSQRLAMIIAVLESRADLRFADKEVYLNVAGGLRINEPAADLAAALALISALLDAPLPEGLAAFGEIGLTGEIRPVSRSDMRLKESAKLGFTKAIMPQGLGKKTVNTSSEIKGLGTHSVRHVDGLVGWLREQ